MGWAALRLVGLPRTELDSVSTRLFDLGAQGLQEDWLPGQAPAPLQPWDEGEPPLADPVLLTAWFEDVDRSVVTEALVDLSVAVEWEDVEDQDWEAMSREGFEPVEVSARITVAPPWDAPEGALIIEPGQGFGTGAHPTTRQALEAVDLFADGLATALDVGTGSGVLAIAAARLGLVATGIDVDVAAIEDARRQAARNEVRVELSTTPLPRVTEVFDLVLANLHAELLVRFADDLVRVTGRHLVLAGILVDREPMVRAAFDGTLGEPQRRVDDEAWVRLIYTRNP